MRKGWLVGLLALGAGVALWMILSTEDQPASTDPGTARGETSEAPGLVGGTAEPETVVVAEPTPEPTHGACSIRGSVTQDGKPVGGAIVEVRDLGGTLSNMRSLMQPIYSRMPALFSTTSAEDGTFRFDRLSAGSYQLKARSVGGVAWARVFCRANRPEVRTVLRLYGGTESLSARARYRDGRPFRGLVSVSAGQPPTWLPDVETDADGRFRIQSLKPGSITLGFIVPGMFRSGFENIIVPRDSNDDFIVDEGLKVHPGRVIADDTEEPIPGARIAYNSSDEESGRRYTSSTESDDNGAFEVLMPSTSFRMWVEKPGFEKLQATPKGDGPIVFRLKRRGRVTGRVLRASDKSPVAGVAVYGWNWHTFGLDYPLDVSGEDGTFEALLGPGKGMVYALGNGWLSDGLSQMKDRSVNPLTLPIKQGEAVSHDVFVVRTAAIEGIVRDAAGDVVAGVSVTAELPRRTWRGFRHAHLNESDRAFVTDSAGRFRLENLVPEFPYEVVARPAASLPGRSTPTPVSSGETREVEIQIPAARWLVVRVVEKGGGAPVAGANVRARQNGHAASGTTDANGMLRLEPLLPADLKVSAHHNDFLRPSGSGPFGGGGHALSDPGFAPETHVIELERGRFFGGVVYDVDGEPRGGGHLGVFAVGQKVKGFGLAGLVAMKDGKFRLGPVASGTYDLVLTEETTGFNRRQVSRWTVKAGAQDLELRVDPSQAETDDDVTYLQVSGPDGKPANAFVRVFSRSGVLFNGPFLQKGRFEIRGIAKGTQVWIDLRSATDASKNKLADVLHGPVSIEPGTLPIQLQAASTIHGVVRGPDGAPRAGILVRQLPVMPKDVPVLGTTFASPSVRTDAKGQFELPGVRTGTRLLVEVPEDLGMQPPIGLGPDQREIDIRLPAGAAFDVSVVDSDGTKLVKAEVVASLPENLAKRTARTNADGVAQLTGLVPGEVYTLTVFAPPGRNNLCKHRKRAWPAAATAVTLAPGRVIDGLVVDGTVGVPHAVVFWKDAHGEWHTEQTDSRGAFQFIIATDAVTLIGAPNQTHDPGAGGPKVRVEPNAKSVRLPVK